MSAAERLISSDDHVDLAHDAIKANLTTKYHAAYDAALMEFGMGMAKTMTSPSLRGSRQVGDWRRLTGEGRLLHLCWLRERAAAHSHVWSARCGASSVTSCEY